MRIRIQKRGLIPALIVAVVFTALLYLAATAGLAAWNSSRSAPQSGVGALPTVVENAPPSVPTTDEYGPPGAVSLVFAGNNVRDGLTGTLANPWITVASNGGAYRALDATSLPPAGAGVMAVSHDGTLLAWPDGSGVVVYDTVSGEVRELEVDGVDHVGAFSPDSRMVLTHGEQLSAVDVQTGEVVATADAPSETILRAAWRPDNSGVDFVSGDELTTLDVTQDEVTAQPTDIPEDASLAWSPAGDQLASLREVDGAKRLFVSRVGQREAISEGEQVSTDGIALDRLIGFSGDRTVAVVAYLLESGSIERILDIPLDGRSATDLTTLPSPGENWVSTDTLAIASDNLVAGSVDYETQLWPWSYTARLVACGLFAFFLFGLYVTRRPRR